MRNVILMKEARFAKQGENFVAVTLPHTWNNLDGQDGGNDYFRGSCCYVKKVEKNDLPEVDRGGKRLENVLDVAVLFMRDRRISTVLIGTAIFLSGKNQSFLHP